MSLKCKLGRHKWKIHWKKGEINSVSGEKSLRECVRCGLRQFWDASYSPYDDFGLYSGTNKQTLTEQEFKDYLSNVETGEK